jgi:hypothetical protein
LYCQNKCNGQLTRQTAQVLTAIDMRCILAAIKNLLCYYHQQGYYRRNVKRSAAGRDTDNPDTSIAHQAMGEIANVIYEALTL